MMMRVIGGLACALALTVGSVATAEELKLDAEKSKIEFLGKKKDGEHAGGFKKFQTKAEAPGKDAEGALEITIDTNSLWSDSEKLTNHLKNPDFFDVRKYPKIVFKATGLETDKESNTTKITGDLTLLDKTVKQVVPAKVEVTEKTVTIVADFKLDRTKWGMTYGEGNIEADVAVKATLVFNR